MKRRFTILTAALVLLVSLAIPMGMRGQTREAVTLQYTGSTTFTWQENTNYANQLNLTASDWSVTGQKNDATNMTACNKDGSIRLYPKSGNGSSIIVSSNNGSTISSISFVMQQNEPTVKVNGNIIEPTNGVYTINSTSFVVINGIDATSGNQVQIKSISINYEGGTPSTTYTVTFNAGDGTFQGNTDFPATSNEKEAGTYALPSAERTGYTFNGWLLTGSTTPLTGNYTVSGNVDFTASYTQNSSGTITATITKAKLELTGNSYSSGDKTIDGITYTYADLMPSGNNIQVKASTGTIKNSTPYPGDIISVVITHSGTARATTINGSADGTNWTQVATGSGSITADFSGMGYKYFQITRGSNAAYWEKIDITYSASASSQSQSDLVITNASTDLTFDLYNNSTAQVINYTTSSTGVITITPATPTNYFSYVHDATAKTITVTPLAVTPNAQTVTISQEADDDYYAGTVTFTVSVDNSTPLADIAALTAQTEAGNYNVALSNAVVTYVNGNYAYIQDASGAVVMYKSSHGLIAGDILNGTATVAYQLRNNNPQITNLEGVTPTSGEAPDPTTLAVSSWNYTFNNVLSQYFKITGATIISSNNKYYISLGGENVQLYGQGDAYNFSITNLSATYTIFGFPTLFNSTKELQIFVVPTAEASTTPTVIINDADLSVPAIGEDGSIEVTYENIDENDIDPEARFFAEDGTTSASYDWITISFDANNDVLYHIAANSSEARTAYFKVYEQSEGVYSNLVTVTQNAYVPTPVGGNYVRITSLDQLTDGSFVIIAARRNETNVNEYSAMHNTASGKPTGVNFTSTTSDAGEILPSSIVNDEDEYYWVVSVNNGVFSFTNANGEMIGYPTSGTDFSTGQFAHSDWSIARETSEETAMIGNYTGFVIRNSNTNTRAFAFNGTAFGAYSTTANLNGSGYNFFLDFFVQTEPQTYPKDITGWSAPGNNLNFYLIASPIGDVNPTAVTIVSREDENVIPADVTTMVSGSYDLYYFDHNRDKEWVNYKKADGTPGAFNTLESGKGYLYANLYDVTLVFRGTGITSGEQTIPLDYYEEGDGFTIDLPGWNLLGNPFAKTAYLTTSNSGITTSFYTMDERGNYISVTNGSIDPMEGVFVHAEGEGQSVTFTTTAPSKSPVLNLNLSNGRRVVDRAIVRFDRGNQLPKLQFREGSTMVYIPVEGQDYAVVNCEEMGELPVSFKAEENGSYNLSLSSEEVSFAYLHLIDNMTGADVDLLQTPSYSFEAKTTDYANRFKLVFATGDNSNDDNFAFFSNGSFVINNDGAATLQVIDVTGRIVKSESINGCANVNVNAAPGVYMLRLINGDNVKVQKVVVK